jgi:hypothetical protein
MTLSDQDREFIELTAERAAEKAAHSAVREMQSTVEATARNEVLKHALLCDGKCQAASALSKVKQLEAGAGGAWKAVAVIFGILAFVVSTAVAVWAAAKG